MKRLGRGAVGTGSGTLFYTVPQGYRTSVTNIDIGNTTASPATVKVHLVASGGSPSAANQLVPDVDLAGHAMFQWVGNQVLDAGDYIQCIASISGIAAHISGEEGRASV